MKKILLFFVLSIFILSGCGKQNNISNPYEIKAGSKILSIHDDKTKFEENGFKTFNSGISLSDDNDLTGFISCKDNCILIDNNVVSVITIYDESVITHKSISPGDDSSKIEDAFEYNNKFEYSDTQCSYSIFFDKNGKELKEENIEAEKAYSISYEVNNSKIESIRIGIE